jgi:hypothetical protein
MKFALANEFVDGSSAVKMPSAQPLLLVSSKPDSCSSKSSVFPRIFLHLLRFFLPCQQPLTTACPTLLSILAAANPLLSSAV